MKRTLETNRNYIVGKQNIRREFERLLKIKRIPPGIFKDQSRRMVEQWSVDVVVGALNGEIPKDYTESGVPEALPKPSQKRIKRAFDLMLKVREMPRGMSESWDWGIIAELDEILARYPMVFKVEMDSLGFPHIVRRPGHGRVDRHEAFTMESLFGIGQIGLSKLRTCECSRWFFAKTPTKTSCSIACRKKKHEQTDDYKKDKAERAKAAYALRKRGYGMKSTKRSRPRPLPAIGKESK